MKPKYYKVIAFLPFYLFTFLLLTSCSDYFDVNVKDKQTTDVSYTRLSNIDQALNGVYGCLRQLPIYYWQMSEMRSDNTWVSTPTTVRPTSQIAHFETSALPNNSIILNCWEDHYALTASASKLLAEIDKVEFSDADNLLTSKGRTGEQLRSEYKAEARFLRALSYFDLVRFFGRVPATTDYLTTDEAFKLHQSEPQDVYNNIIIPDLKYAIENLEYSAYDYKGETRAERVTKPAAEALLARVYLTMAGYPLYDESHKSEAVNLLKDVIDYSESNGNKWWAKDINEWNSMWVHENDNKYYIFEVQYGMMANMGNPVTPISVAWSLVNSSWCTRNQVSADVIIYGANKLRKHFTEPEYDTDSVAHYDKRGPGTFSTISVNDDGVYEDGDANNCFNVKFFESIKKRESLDLQSIDGQVVDRTYWPQNFPIIRFEDVLLMYAELVGPTSEGYNAINRIRERAGLLPLSGLSADEFQQAVRRERQYELAGEGYRWFDLVRWNTYVDTMKDLFNEYDMQDYAKLVTKDSGLYPIPLSQIQVREGLYTQNPGY